MRRLFTLLVVAAVLAAVAAGAGGYVVWTRMHQAYRGFTGEQFVEIPQGAGSRAIGRRLADAGVVPDAWTFRAALRWSGRGRELQAGEYRFDGCRVAARDRRAAGPRAMSTPSRSPFPKG